MNGKQEVSLSMASPEREEKVVEFRSLMNHALLGLVSHRGLYYWERRARTQHLLSWEELLKHVPEEVLVTSLESRRAHKKQETLAKGA